jgi:hypothetical protein
MNHKRKFQIVVIFAMLLSLLGFTVALAASTVSLNNYQIDLIEANKVDDQSTWTYAITASGDELQTMSGWTVSIDKNCTYLVTTPLPSTAPDRSYTTLTSYVLQKGASAGSDVCDGTYNCEAASYSVSNRDPDSNILGVHFSNPDVALGSASPVTHIFQFTLLKTGDHNVADGPTSLTVSTNSFESGVISSPACPPTAVDLVQLSASSNANFTALWILGLAAGLCVLVLAVITYRRSIQ